MSANENEAAELAAASRVSSKGIRLLRLRLSGTERNYEVDFRQTHGEVRSLAIIAGAFSTGKTTVLEFIDYCLGASSHPKHPEVLARVRSAALELTLSGVTHVIERPVGEPSTTAYVRPGELEDSHRVARERRKLRPVGDPDSLSSLLLSHIGLEGVELREAPTRADSQTDPLSFRDVMWLSYLPNERLDDKNLLFESAYMKNLKLKQVVDVIFDVHDDRAVELGRRVRELESRMHRARVAFQATQSLAEEAQFGDPIRLTLERESIERELAELEQLQQQLDERLQAHTSFAEELRALHLNATRKAREVEASVRDRDTLLRRMIPLRAQYAADVTKLSLLDEAQHLFDPLRVTVCPACLSNMHLTPRIAEGRCSLCNTAVSESLPETLTIGVASENVEVYQTSTEEAEFSTVNVATELRATRRRLTEITDFVEQLDRELSDLRRALDDAQQAEAAVAGRLDAATSRAVTPFLAERDDLGRRRTLVTARLEKTQTGLQVLEAVERRGTTVFRLERTVEQAREALAAIAQIKGDRRAVIRLLSARFGELLKSWRYPKLDGQEEIKSDLTPSVRGLHYTDASSGGRTLISLAWQLAIFEVAWERNAHHPGFLLLDSPQKNLGQGGERDAEFADTIVIGDVYRHIQEWLNGSGRGAQVIVVDNSPPELVDGNIVVRYTRRPDQPPYGLIEDEVS